MILAELLQVMDDEWAITIQTYDENDLHIPFIGYKSEFDEAIEEELESEEKEELIKCLDKEVTSITRSGLAFMKIRINALQKDITPECPEPDLSYRP